MDSIADMLARINNALKVRKDGVDLPHSRVKEEIARLLLAEGFISKYDVFSRLNKKFIRLGLKYAENKKSVITGLKRVSKSSRRIYVGTKNIPWIEGGFGTVILSTPKGLMTDSEARAQKVGGEILCYVW